MWSARLKPSWQPRVREAASLSSPRIRWLCTAERLSASPGATAKPSPCCRNSAAASIMWPRVWLLPFLTGPQSLCGQLRRALCALGRSVPEGLCGHRRMPGQGWRLRHTGAGRFSGGKHQRVLEYSGRTAHRKGDPDFRHGRLASSGSIGFSVLRRPAWGFDSIHKSFVKRGMGHHEGVEAASGILSHEQQFC